MTKKTTATQTVPRAEFTESSYLSTRTAKSMVVFLTLILSSCSEKPATPTSSNEGISKCFVFPIENYQNTGGWTFDASVNATDFFDACSDGETCVNHTGEDVSNGLDPNERPGSPINSASTGLVTYVGDWKNENGTKVYGKVVVVSHSRNLHTQYGHLGSTNLINQGAIVYTGQKIGELATAVEIAGLIPHLHFAVYSGAFDSRDCLRGYTLPNVSAEATDFLSPNDYLNSKHQSCGELSSLMMFACSGKALSNGPSDLWAVIRPSAESSQPRAFVTRDFNLGRLSESESNSALAITDLAGSPDGDLYAVGDNDLYIVNHPNSPHFDRTEPVGTLNRIQTLPYSTNAAGLSTTGELYVGTTSGSLYRVDVEKGTYARVLKLSDQNGFSGDIVFYSPVAFYATANSGNDVLIHVDLTTLEIREIGPIGVQHVFGLAFDNGILYGLTATREGNGTLIRIDTDNATGTPVRAMNFSAFGGG
ncbi:MAG: hypothetical protein Kow0074_20180 [Candidatus Zixiibacteriota bacterium]